MTTAGYDLTIAQMTRGFAEGSLSPVTVMQAVLDRAEAFNPRINALIFIDGDLALEQARASEQRWQQGAVLGPLDGVPITVKDSIAEASRPMYRGSKAHVGSGPVGKDAPPAARLKEAGAIIWAKTTMPDFGMLATGVSSAYGITRNPWNLACNTGGSSSGAAASVAARCGPGAIGTDLGGSVRLPAAFCGLVSLKPTQGRIPHLPPSPVRSAGPLTRTVLDNALLLNVLARPDARDYGALPYDPVDYAAALPRDVKGLRLGLQLDAMGDVAPIPAVRAAVEKAAAVLEANGASVEIVPNALPADLAGIMVDSYLVRGAMEFRKLPEERRALVLADLVPWFPKADAMSGFDYAACLDRIEAAKGVLLGQLAGLDYLLTPTTLVAGFPAEETRGPLDGFDIPLATSMWNQTGNPAITVPCGIDPDSGVPIGLQIVGQRFDDRGVLQLAAAYEALRGFAMPWPE
ncbi:amidase [Novosphingobium sp. 1949]|uniref:Amidase n=1 Tax=Novosphingobium organovorum TaxID=2930092 RepID=A0ABT0BBY7_9SPHN|nr:amidase [Novosphingobium organovorum]MCJ2182528.1 amidase [Novosphingobium organovorum]